MRDAATQSVAQDAGSRFTIHDSRFTVHDSRFTVHDFVIASTMLPVIPGLILCLELLFPCFLWMIILDLQARFNITLSFENFQIRC